VAADSKWRFSGGLARAGWAQEKGHAREIRFWSGALEASEPPNILTIIWTACPSQPGSNSGTTTASNRWKPRALLTYQQHQQQRDRDRKQ
jgi:hypothetical protein